MRFEKGGRWESEDAEDHLREKNISKSKIRMLSHQRTIRPIALIMLIE